MYDLVALQVRFKGLRTTPNGAQWAEKVIFTEICRGKPNLTNGVIVFKANLMTAGGHLWLY
ncbi:MAG: hypothetical protein CTY19_16180 [Methylomonas sp.]|nr:MAG: hypothetical protein CTY19_16180 [Methylomonas sp.]